MRTERDYWPLTWTVTPLAGESRVTIFDLVELRSVVDTLRVAAGLLPIPWVGRADDDPTFVAGRTPIRAGHFTQIREAIAELHDNAALRPIPGFSGGPIVPGSRVIRLGDTLDLRGWVERYEAARPDLAARVVRKYGAYTAPEIADEAPEGKLTELWDGAGFSCYFYDRRGWVVRELRVLDSHEYWTGYEYDETGRVTALTYPDGERIGYEYDTWGEMVNIRPNWGSQLGEPIGPILTGERALAQAWERTGETTARYDPIGRPVLLGNPANPVLRLAYDGNGKLVKRLDDRGTVHFVGERYERRVAPSEDSESTTKYVPDWSGGRWALRRARS